MVNRTTEENSANFMVFLSRENTKILPSASGNSSVPQAERNDARTVIQHSLTCLPGQTAPPCCLNLDSQIGAFLLPSGSFSADEQKPKTRRKTAIYTICLCDYFDAFTLEHRSRDKTSSQFFMIH